MDFQVRLQHKGKGQWPRLKGQIVERGIIIGRFERPAVKDGFIPPITTRFYSDAARARFDNFADSLSIEETIDALMPR